MLKNRIQTAGGYLNFEPGFKPGFKP